MRCPWNDVLWSARQVVSLIKEWKIPGVLLKTEKKKAFDATNRKYLASKLKGWAAERFPAETRCLLRLLGTNHMEFVLPWSSFTIESNTEVRQGSIQQAKRQCPD